LLRTVLSCLFLFPCYCNFDVGSITILFGHKDGTWGPEAEATYEEFKKLHVDQIKGHGDDNHTVEEVYSRVFKGSSGYIKGLGAGPRHPKKIRIEDELNELSLELQSQLAEQINQPQQESTDREAALN